MARPFDRWARRLRILPPALLVAVALAQVALVRVADLSRWHGGGFGMFSTLDAAGRRHLHAFQLRPGIRREIPVPPGEGSGLPAALALPTEARLRAIAREVARVESPDHGPPVAVRVQVFRPHFDPDTLAPSTTILREVEIPTP